MPQARLSLVVRAWQMSEYLHLQNSTAACMSPLLFVQGHSPQITAFLLALTSAAALLLVLFLVFHFSVVKQGRKKLLYLLKRRKANTDLLQPAPRRPGFSQHKGRRGFSCQLRELG